MTTWDGSVWGARTFNSSLVNLFAGDGKLEKLFEGSALSLFYVGTEGGWTDDEYTNVQYMECTEFIENADEVLKSCGAGYRS